MVVCSRCGATQEAAAAFCGSCGTRLSSDVLPSRPSVDPLIGTVIDSRYRIVALIGRGGMGSVYRAVHVNMGKILAVKILVGELAREPDLVRRFRREAEAASRLGHANTVSVFDFGQWNGMMYLAMEFIDGPDLAELIRSEGPLPPRRAAGIVSQICAALAEAHAKGVIHRDLKPENVIVARGNDGADVVKVVDFGLAKLRDAGGLTKITAEGSLVGTPLYMAPEHIRGDDVDARTDIYSLGALMYKMLTGEPPFSAATAMAIVTKHLTEAPEPPSRRCPHLRIPAVADDIVLKAMAKKPSDRFASAVEMGRAVAGLTLSDDGEPPPAPRNTLATPTSPRDETIGTRSDFDAYRKRRRKRRLALKLSAGAGALILTGAALLFVFHRSNGPRETEPNDTEPLANVVPPGVIVSGALDTASDVDRYCLSAGATAGSVRVGGVPGSDIALDVRLAPGQAEIPVNIAGAGLGEAVVLPASAGPVCVAVRRAHPESAGELHATGSAYRILFQ